MSFQFEEIYLISRVNVIEFLTVSIMPSKYVLLGFGMMKL